jgi:hypothetical protein
MENLRSGPWNQRCSEGQRIHLVDEINHRYFPKFVESQQEIQQTRILFDAHGDIRPVHCRYALNALETLNTRVAATCKLLRTDNENPQTFNLPSLIIHPSYYPLLSTLHHIQDHISTLMRFIDTYRIDCCPSISPSQLGYQRQAIREQYVKLSHYLTVFPTLVKSLEEETYKHQQT